MRLVCPNCGAQYEVPDEVIPEVGRDVQCCSCGHTWFQAHPDHDRALAEELDQPVPDADWQPPRPEPEPAPEPQPAPQEQAAHVPTHEPERTPVEEPQRRELDPSVADLLREEAEQETRAREAEALESQPDLGLNEPEEIDEVERRAREARTRMARMRGEADDIAPAAAEGVAAATASTTTRRGMLPDIDEINSTLRSGSERRESPVEQAERAETAPRKKRGFKRGFMLILLLVLIAVLVYVFAPQIREYVPQADPYLAQYVEQVDKGRAWLNTTIADGLVWLDSMASTATGGGEDTPAGDTAPDTTAAPQTDQ